MSPSSPTAERAATETRRTERVYSVLARVYDGFFDWALGPGRRQAISSLPLRGDERVLEVGVGTGLSLPHYPNGCRVTGIDISEPMLEQARRRADALGRPDTDLRLMNAARLAFPDETFDHVVAPYVVSVVSDPRRVMTEMCRVCRPGGSVVIVNHFLSPARTLAFFERLLTPASQWVGFRMDVPIEVVTGTDGLELSSVESVNLLGLWRLVTLKRRA